MLLTPDFARRASMRVRLSALTAAIALPAVLFPSAAVRSQSVTNAQFVNGLAIPGNTVDLTNGSDFERRFGMFSDLYYDRNRNEWWGLADRGPGGGTIAYDTRIQRFSLNVNVSTGAISGFQLLQTIKFMSQGVPLNGLAPSPSSILGNAFDPEGVVVSPTTGNLLISDEYGPSLYEISRTTGEVIRRFTTPANLIPRNSATPAVPNFASDAGNTKGKTTNRGFEGLAVSPDGKFAYATLQSGMLDEGAGSGLYSRIVKFDVATGAAVAQYAYKLDVATQGRGVSALVALGNDKFLILERNNRGLGFGATFATADKIVYQIDLTGATDISGITITGGALPANVTTVSKGAKIIDLDAVTLAALGNKSPEKWEGLAIGPQLSNGKYLILTGTDNDFSVTQNSQSVQFDVYLRFTDADPYAASIQCPIGLTTGCFSTSNANSATLNANYSLLPGVLQAYSADITGYEPVVTPEPASIALVFAGLVAVGAAVRRRRA